MKKIQVYVLIAASAVVLTGCGRENKTENNNNNKQQEEVTPMTRIKTGTGLEYEIIKEGSGAMPQKGHPVTVHYTGWLDVEGQPGTKFDSSVDRGTPFTFVIGVSQVIRGWDEGVMSMKIGEKRRLYIPAALGYGARGAGRVIPANANLIFDVELISVP